jgi:pimeloyl-ACP methyl ester carboxylesterase
MFEHIEDGLLDLTAWVDFAKREGFEHVGIAAHSLGAVKAAYAYAHGLARTQRFIALSPPRLNTGTLSDDPKKGALFRAHIELAQSLVEQGKANEIIKVRFPLANWVSAGTFLDKYGSNDKYDYLKVVEQVPVPVLWIFGEQETRDGSANFRNADERLMDSIVSSNLARQSVRVVASADHSYRETRVELCDCIQAWLES